MKFSRVYIQILFTYLVLLIITEIAIFSFFVLFAGRAYRDYHNEYNQAQFHLAREITEYQIEKTAPDLSQPSPAFNEFITRLGLAFKAKIWITGDDDKVLIKSFAEEIPTQFIARYLSEKQRRRSFLRENHQFEVYRFEEIGLHGEKWAVMHVLFDARPPFPHKIGFAIGLFSIGLIIALLTFPLARKISRPVKALTDSAKRLENGDLSHRTTVRSGNEIGELASAFNKMAEKLERMVTSSKEMTAQVSHELRSPLARIQIAVEILKDRLSRQDDEEVTGHLKEIQVDVEELDTIIGRILELSKLDLQADDIYTDVFSPVKMLKETMERYDSLLKSKRVSVHAELTTDAKILGNRVAFSTVLNNLLDNTSRYTPTQGRVRMETRRENDRLVMTIANSGTRLADVDLKRIFDPFVRIDTNGKNGAGLGLSIARKIITRHGGTIQACNTESGLEFSIVVPVVKLE